MSHRILSDKHGVIAIVAGLSLVLVLGFAALVVDLGYGLVARNALQNVADGASLAATRKLGEIYTALPVDEQSSYQVTDPDRAEIVARAVGVGEDNAAAGKAVLINAADIAIGRWDPDTKTLQVGDDRPDAVRVMTRRDALGNGPIRTFFAGIIGQDTLSVTAHATAALSGLSYVGPGTLEMPVGISEAKFKDGPDNFCGAVIRFYPTGTELGCGGWTTFDEPSNASVLDGILDGMLDGSYTSPEVQVGGTALEFTGGNVAGALPELQALYDDRKNEDGEWETTVAVYAADDCSNPTGELQIVGFAKVIISAVWEAPAQQIDATIVCEKFEDGRGGGANLGVIGSIPNLVQ